MLERAFAVIRALSEAQPDGGRVTRLAKAVGMTQGTVHRILHALIAEGIVEQVSRQWETTPKLTLPCEGSGQRGHRAICPATHAMCAMCGRVMACPDPENRMPDHDRRDILAEIERATDA